MHAVQVHGCMYDNVDNVNATTTSYYLYVHCPMRMAVAFEWIADISLLYPHEPKRIGLACDSPKYGRIWCCTHTHTYSVTWECDQYLSPETAQLRFCVDIAIIITLRMPVHVFKSLLCTRLFVLCKRQFALLFLRGSNLVRICLSPDYIDEPIRISLFFFEFQKWPINRPLSGRWSLWHGIMRRKNKLSSDCIALHVRARTIKM